MKSLTNHKKNSGVNAVSPVIANVLMAGAVVAIGLSVLVWATSTFSAHQSGAGTLLSSRGEAMKESFVIEDVWFFEDSEKHVNVAVRNVGAVDVEIASIYMDGEEVWDEGQWITVGNAVTIYIPVSWDAEEHCIVVATSRGNQVREWYNAL